MKHHTSITRPSSPSKSPQSIRSEISSECYTHILHRKEAKKRKNGHIPCRACSGEQKPDRPITTLAERKALLLTITISHRLLSYAVHKYILDPSGLPPLLRSVRGALFPNNLPGTSSLTAPSSEDELLALRRRCAKDLWALISSGFMAKLVGSVYFSGRSSGFGGKARAAGLKAPRSTTGEEDTKTGVVAGPCASVSHSTTSRGTSNAGSATVHPAAPQNSSQKPKHRAHQTPQMEQQMRSGSGPKKSGLDQGQQQQQAVVTTVPGSTGNSGQPVPTHQQGSSVGLSASGSLSSLSSVVTPNPAPAPGFGGPGLGPGWSSSSRRGSTTPSSSVTATATATATAPSAAGIAAAAMATNIISPVDPRSGTSGSSSGSSSSTSTTGNNSRNSSKLFLTTGSSTTNDAAIRAAASATKTKLAKRVDDHYYRQQQQQVHLQQELLDAANTPAGAYAAHAGDDHAAAASASATATGTTTAAAHAFCDSAEEIDDQGQGPEVVDENDDDDENEETILKEIEEGILDVFSDAYLNKHLIYSMLELIVVRLIPEMAEKRVSELLGERLA